MKIDNKEFLNPQQQLYQNTKDIEKLKADYMPVYSFGGVIGSTTQHTLPRSSTNVPEGVNLGWIMDYVGKLFKITDGSDTTLLIDYYAQIKGPKGDTGNTGPQGETGPQGPQGPQGEPGETTIGIEVVQALPATGEEGVIYFVPKQDSDTGDLYEEYAYVNDNWELLGGATVDLTNYALKSEIPVVNEGFTPKTSFTYDLGSSTKLYKDLYVGDIRNTYFKLITGGVNGHGTVVFNSTDAQGNTEATLRLDYNKIQANQNLVPSANNTLDLGTSGLKYKDLYLAGNLTDGTNSVAIADIVTTSDLPNYNITNVVTDNSDVLGMQVYNTSAGISYNFYNTNANPTLAGTESDLTSIDIGGTAYKIPSGGSTPTNMVTTDTDQTITGFKTISNAMKTQQLRPAADDTYDLGYRAGNTMLRYKNLWLSGKLRNYTNSYGILLPDTSGYTADKTMATTDQIGAITYTTTAPTAANTDGTLHTVLLTSEPSTYYGGYIYYITEA